MRSSIARDAAAPRRYGVRWLLTWVFAVWLALVVGVSVGIPSADALVGEYSRYDGGSRFDWQLEWMRYWGIAALVQYLLLGFAVYFTLRPELRRGALVVIGVAAGGAVGYLAGPFVAIAVRAQAQNFGLDHEVLLTVASRATVGAAIATAISWSMRQPLTSWRWTSVMSLIFGLAGAGTALVYGHSESFALLGAYSILVSDPGIAVVSGLELRRALRNRVRFDAAS